MKHQESKEPTTIGIDVGKSYLDVYFHPQGLHQRIKNTDTAVQKLTEALVDLKPERIVVEATGRHGSRFVFASDKASLPIVVADPVKVRHFLCQSSWSLGKTDKVDARAIALYAAKMKPDIRPISDEKYRLIKDLLIRRKQLLDMRTMEKNRLQIMPKALHSSINAMLKVLDKLINKITEQLNIQVQQEQRWRVPLEILSSTPGCRTCACLYAHQRAARTG